MLQVLLVTVLLAGAIALPTLLAWGVVGRMMSEDFDERERL